jgi:FMN phosphatase YigB (HAD superfamily)
MIKYIAFDLVGVLVREKDIELSIEEEKLERMFGPNIDDASYLKEGRLIIPKDSLLMATTLKLLDKLYYVVDKNLLKNIKELYPEVKIIVATNHVSYIRDFIGEYVGIDYLDDVLISAEIHKIKPNPDFYEYILNKYHLDPSELLFLDDNISNIEGAKSVNVNTIHVTRDMDILNEIKNIMDN